MKHSTVFSTLYCISLVISYQKQKGLRRTQLFFHYN